MSFHIETIPNRGSPPAVLIRKAWREDGRLRKKTVGNIPRLPLHIISGMKALFKGGVAVSSPEEPLTIRRSLPHGHVAAVLGTLRRTGMIRVLHRAPGRMRDLAVAALTARVAEPAPELATARALSPETTSSSLGKLPGLGHVTGNEMLDMPGWLPGRQPWIERSLARRHLTGGTLILYDISSSCLEGRCCPLAAFGHSRDGKRGRMQINYGLLRSADGCPVAVEVLPGNTADPETVAAQVGRIRSRFRIARVALVGDRGMLTTARIREDLEPAGPGWISALKTSDIRRLLMEGGSEGGERTPAPLVPEALVPDAVAEVTGPDFPGERLMVCLNPRLRGERRRRRGDLLSATETTLAEIAAAAARGKPGPGNRDRTIKALGRRANRRRVDRHFDVSVREDGMDWARDPVRIAAEARLDGIYIVRTSLDAGAIAPEAAVEAYRSLAGVERAFRTMKLSRLNIRPVHVYSTDHVRAHVFLCMLACHVEWHMRRRLAPILSGDDDREGAVPARHAGRASQGLRGRQGEASMLEIKPGSGFFSVFSGFRIRLSRTFPQRSPQAAPSGHAGSARRGDPGRPEGDSFPCRTAAVRPCVRRRWPPSGPPRRAGRGEGRWRSRPACA